ncbi:MAG: hypothetical protein JJE19_05270 [Methanosarcinales archaeon]|nr:hypothetical protein [Methanosarcinales archaeon]
MSEATIKIPGVDKTKLEKDKKEEEEPMLLLLESVGHYGKTDARKMDKYLYGVGE